MALLKQFCIHHKFMNISLEPFNSVYVYLNMRIVIFCPRISYFRNRDYSSEHIVSIVFTFG
jgi:hypothetical protein